MTWAEGRGINISEILKNFEIPTLFIQKTHDPAYSYGDLVKLLESLNVKNFKTAEIAGDDHHYENIEALRELIKSFID